MEKIKLNGILDHKQDSYEPCTAEVEKVVELSGNAFERLKNQLSAPNPDIEKYRDLMYTDSDDVAHCVLFINDTTGDGIIVNSEGADYARKSQFIPCAKDIFELQISAITQGEQKLLELLGNISDMIAQEAKLGNRNFTLEDVMSDIGIEESDIKRATLRAISDVLNKREDISGSEIHDIGIPFQPDLTVAANEEYEETTADMGGISVMEV